MKDNILDNIPLERLTHEEIRKSLARFESFEVLTPVLDAVPYPILILNRYRQIVFGNKAVYAFVKDQESVGVKGLRPGEFMRCLNAGNTEGGCGAHDNCRLCRLLSTVLESAGTGSAVKNEADLTLQWDWFSRTYEFEVFASPISLSGETYSLVTLNDISEEKRRKMLERLFFHDIINLAGGLKGIMDLIGTLPDSGQKSNLLEDAIIVAGNLLEEMRAQKELISAESGEYMPSLSPFVSTVVVESAVRQLRFHPSADKRTIAVIPHGEPFEIVSDMNQLARVIVNMLKNALEATERGGTVEIWCEKKPDGTADFSVRNASVIPDEVQRVMFRRSFSTKGANRGLGTYSIKLLTERYLKGSVSFVSNDEQGTVFTVTLPLLPLTQEGSR